MDLRHTAIKEMRQYLRKSSNSIHDKRLCHEADMKCLMTRVKSSKIFDVPLKKETEQ